MGGHTFRVTHIKNIGVEWQYHRNQLLCRFGTLAGIEKQPKNLSSRVIFIVFFKFQIAIAGGDGINQFFIGGRA